MKNNKQQSSGKQKVLQIVTPGKTQKTKRGKSEFELIVNPNQDPNLMKESKSFLDWIGEEYGAGFEGTDKLVKKYKKDTPCAVCKNKKCSCEVNESEKKVVSADRTRYKVMTPTGSRWYTRRRAENILRKKDADKTVTEHVVLTEEDTMKIKKVLFLAQQGMVKSSELSRYKITIRKLLQTKSLTQAEKDYLNAKYDDLLTKITSDQQLYQRFRAIL